MMMSLASARPLYPACTTNVVDINSLNARKLNKIDEVDITKIQRLN